MWNYKNTPQGASTSCTLEVRKASSQMSSPKTRTELCCGCRQDRPAAANHLLAHVIESAAGSLCFSCHVNSGGHKTRHGSVQSESTFASSHLRTRCRMFEKLPVLLFFLDWREEPVHQRAGDRSGEKRVSVACQLSTAGSNPSASSSSGPTRGAAVFDFSGSRWHFSLSHSCRYNGASVRLCFLLVLRRVDLVVHSLKDLPTTLPPGFTIGAVLKYVGSCSLTLCTSRLLPEKGWIQTLGMFGFRILPAIYLVLCPEWVFCVFLHEVCCWQ